MKTLNIFALSFIFALFLFTSCQKEDDPIVTPAINESEVLATFLESAASPLGKDFVNTDLPTIIGATEVKTLNETGQVLIFDIRSATDFAAGHIKNAINLPIANLVGYLDTAVVTNYTKIALVCYTGQTAGYAASLLRLLGHSKVFSMKFGMCAWHSDFASKWNSAISNSFATQFVSTASPKNAMGSLPKISTGKTTGLEILKARVNALMTEGFTPATVTKQTVFDNLSTYYIVNYWPADQYADPGHIPGAVQYTPKQSMKLATDLKTLPTNKPIVVYCYTGQTSAFLTAYLRLLGYDAKSLLYGTNGLIYDIMVTKGMTTFGPTQIMGYPYEI